MSIKEKLSAFDKDALCRWYVSLNCFEWPSDFPIPNPIEILSDTQQYDKAAFENPIWRECWNAIKELTTEEEKSRSWWLLRLKKTEDEWRTWWLSEGRRSFRSLSA